MSVIGVDIGDYNTYISVARPGGVDTIANEYSQRNTPSIVALGDRQRFMGVSAENQRNLNVRNTVSFFKNFLGRSFKDPYVQKELPNVGAEVVELADGKIGFNLGSKPFVPEQILGMMLTKVREIVRTEQKEDIETCVISVPLHFSQTQRAAVLDSARLAGLPAVQIINDTSALALAYGKTKSDLPEDAASPRYVIFVDLGCGGLQTSLAAVSKYKATVLATSTSTATGGKFMDSALLNYTVAEIENKYGCQIRNNKKAINKLRLAVEKIKKQMSANSNKLPLQIENLCEDVDVSLSLDRAKFEELIQADLEEVKRTLSLLLDSTTVTKSQLHSVELVGGSSRIPAVRQIVQDLFDLQPSYSLNADEGVSRGCGLQAAANSNKFMTKTFHIEEVVSHAMEAVYNHEGVQEKLVIFDEGEAAKEERIITLKADLPLHLALQYGEHVDISNRFISLYELAGHQEMKNADLELAFSVSPQGLINMDRARVLITDESKRRKTTESTDPTLQKGGKEGEEEKQQNSSSSREVTVSVTSLAGLPTQLIAHLQEQEKRMIEDDLREVSRQEAKNLLEETLYKLRSEVAEASEGFEAEEAVNNMKSYFDQIENWLYDEGEDVSEESYRDILKQLKDRVKVFQMWRSRMVEMRAREQERSSRSRPSPGVAPQSGRSRQIPVVYEGEAPYTRQSPARPHSAPRRHVMEDPFFTRSSFYNDPLFGW